MSRTNKDILHDGIKLRDNVRDASCSKCKYILPGDPVKEVYRLLTFNYVSAAAVDKHKLSQAGFYSTGFKDRVKCFSCGVQCENWSLQDNPFDSTYHFMSCLHIHDTDPTNVEIDRIFTKAFGLRPEMTTSSNRPGGSQQSAATSSEGIQGTAGEKYLCLHPCSPHMRLVEVRLETFSTGWPSHGIRATPNQIATAGMFYLGNRDRVKCWYCNGGLQNWDTSDDPWFEHAKWYPECEFVLQSKGEDFVQVVVSIYPDLQRPNLPNTQSSSAGPSGGSRGEIQIIDPRAATNAAETLVIEAMSNDACVEVARSLNFTDSSIKSALTRQFAENNRAFDNAEQLIDAILCLDESAVSQPSKSQLDTTTNVFTELQSIQNTMQCRLCKTNPATVFTLPCGHLCSCKNCSEKIQRCPMCYVVITEKRHIFRV